MHVDDADVDAFIAEFLPQINPEWSPEQRALVFPNTVGRIGRYSTFLEHVWQPLLRKAGLRYRKAHSMRHTFATWALEGNEDKGIPPEAVDAFAKAMKAAGESLELHRYDAPHGFANPSGAHYDAAAAEDAWSNVRAFFAKHLRG